MATRRYSGSAASWLVALAVVFGVSGSWVGSTQLAKVLVAASVTGEGVRVAPSFVVWFTTVFNIFVEPLVRTVACTLRREQALLQAVPTTALLRYAAFLYPLWILANYSYTRALISLSPSSVTAVFSCTSVAVWALELCILPESNWRPLKLVAAVMSVAGVGMVCAEGDSMTSTSSEAVTGYCLAAAASVFAALYKVLLYIFNTIGGATSVWVTVYTQVLFKRKLSNANLGSVARFLSLVGVVNIPAIVCVFALQGVPSELVLWPEIPWGPMAGHAASALAFNFAVNFGISVTYPLVVAIGSALGIPLNMVVDVAFRGVYFGVTQVFGCLTVFISVGLMMVDDWRMGINSPLRISEPHDGPSWHECEDDDTAGLFGTARQWQGEKTRSG